jgi:hypothetical protein
MNYLNPNHPRPLHYGFPPPDIPYGSILIYVHPCALRRIAISKSPGDGEAPRKGAGIRPLRWEAKLSFHRKQLAMRSGK